MAGLDPAIHVLLRLAKNVDAGDKPGHDDNEGYPENQKAGRRPPSSKELNKPK
jgi:hypothetical protein